jgi:hypothetical protein
MSSRTNPPCKPQAALERQSDSKSMAANLAHLHARVRVYEGHAVSKR